MVCTPSVMDGRRTPSVLWNTRTRKLAGRRASDRSAAGPFSWTVRGSSADAGATVTEVRDVARAKVAAPASQRRRIELLIRRVPSAAVDGQLGHVRVARGRERQ